MDKRADFAGHPIGLRRRRKFCGLVLLEVGTGERTPEKLRDVGRRIVVELERLLDFLCIARVALRCADRGGAEWIRHVASLYPLADAEEFRSRRSCERNRNCLVGVRVPRIALAPIGVEEIDFLVVVEFPVGHVGRGACREVAKALAVDGAPFWIFLKLDKVA